MVAPINGKVTGATGGLPAEDVCEVGRSSSGATLSKAGISDIKGDLGATSYGADMARATGLLATGKDSQLALTRQQRAQVTQIGRSAISGGSTQQVQSRWSSFISEFAAQGAALDVNALVQEVLRESYLQINDDLRFYADKVKFFNELKKSIREEMKLARNELAPLAGQGDDAMLAKAYIGKSFDTDFTGTTAAQAQAVQVLQVQAGQASGGGIRGYTGQPQLVPPPGPNAKKFMSQPGNYIVAVEGSTVQFYGPDGHQLGYIWGDPHYRQGETMDNSLTGTGVMHFGDDSTYILPDGTKVCINCEQIDTGEYVTGGVTILSGDQRVSVGKEPNGQEGDGVIHEDRVAWDAHNADTAGTADTGVLALQPDGKLLLHVGDGKFRTVDWEDWEAYKGDRDIDASGSTVTADASIAAAAADGKEVQALTGDIDTKEELNTYIKNLEDKLNSVGDDAQLANVDLQNVLQKQQQTMQMMSNISKMLHDTAMAVIRKIGG